MDQNYEEGLINEETSATCVANHKTRPFKNPLKFNDGSSNQRF
jgi:hypothetical protein